MVIVRRSLLSLACSRACHSGLNGATSPNEKLNIAGVGIGGQGGNDINQMKSENIVALCDVDSNHAAGMFKQFPQATLLRKSTYERAVARWSELGLDGPPPQVSVFHKE